MYWTIFFSIFTTIYISSDAALVFTVCTIYEHLSVLRLVSFFRFLSCKLCFLSLRRNLRLFLLDVLRCLDDLFFIFSLVPSPILKTLINTKVNILQLDIVYWFDTLIENVSIIIEFDKKIIINKILTKLYIFYIEKKR